jgi:hypothetical protein
MRVTTKKRIYAYLLFLGASILLFRTIRLAFLENGLEKLLFIPILLLFIELASDGICIIASFLWSCKLKKTIGSIALRSGAFSTVLHLQRVVIFALGRSKYFKDFDIKPEYRNLHEIDAFWVIFALTLSIMGIIGLLIVSCIVMKKTKSSGNKE